MSEQKVYDKAREMEREARAVEEGEAFDEAADRASLEAVLEDFCEASGTYFVETYRPSAKTRQMVSNPIRRDDLLMLIRTAKAIVTREGQDPQGLGGEAIERGPAGMRPEERAQPSLHIEPETERAAFEAWADRNQFETHRDDTDKYRDYHRATTRWAWMAWQARAASPTTPTEGPAQTLTVDDLCGLDTPARVRFYEHDFYPLSNFSAFTLYWRGLRFDTSEAAYHYEKFPDWPEMRAYIKNAPSAHEAFKHAEANKMARRPDWADVKVDIMRDILRAKAEQHEYVRRKLLATCDRELVEDSWRDDFWGWGPNRDGQNMLGRLWMEVRAELRASDRNPEGGDAHAAPGRSPESAVATATRPSKGFLKGESPQATWPWDVASKSSEP